MNYANPGALVSTEWLSKHLSAPDVRVVDATFFLPNVPRDARAEYLERHIPGAVFFDIDDICDPDTDLPHMLPSPEMFSSKVRKLGLGDGNRIVVYDAFGIFAASARVWWMFRVFGHEDIAVLDGGLPKWLAEGRPVDDIEPTPRERHFTARMNHTLVRDIDHMIANLESRREQVVDARSSGRFDGIDHEPRPTERNGHIPGSVNLPFSALVDKDNNFVMRSADDITAAFDAIGVDVSKPIVGTCGSGVTASVVAFALFLIGHDEIPVYDGSWAEWGNRADTPVEN